MKKAFLLACAGTLALAACSEAGDESAVSYESAEESAAADAAYEADSAPATQVASGSELPSAQAEIPVSIPQMAYVFNYGFRLPGDGIAALQQKHADLCEAQGPYTCRILSLRQSGDEGDYASGSLTLAVASDKARGFGEKLAASVKDAGGEQVSSTIDGEDLSKNIVDTEARLRVRTVLRDRLLEVLRTRNGKVSELVEAERSVARVNEEIDQARSWLEEMRGRVAFSRVEISYQSSAPAAGAFLEPIRGAVGSLGGIFGMLVAVLIVLAALGVPLVLGALGVRCLRGYLGRWRGLEGETA
ncbi:DUF4349 domain-containing protein [Altererythrobacter salegens]|uniref:DUF4349 domain-containing protein n=1 Tax=Croceibacterium salegens TaxID=1737568 RepID=A0A6I4T2C8_9SPHN|nr:DUF4349 domain-containing protein [Croceibacterium salegens]MXO61387.1 DUF4349 domain-containing protein [Croceibacterium salegens]